MVPCPLPTTPVAFTIRLSLWMRKKVSVTASFSPHSNQPGCGHPSARPWSFFHLKKKSPQPPHRKDHDPKPENASTMRLQPENYITLYEKNAAPSPGAQCPADGSAENQEKKSFSAAGVSTKAPDNLKAVFFQFLAFDMACPRPVKPLIDRGTEILNF